MGIFTRTKRNNKNLQIDDLQQSITVDSSLDSLPEVKLSLADSTLTHQQLTPTTFKKKVLTLAIVPTLVVLLLLTLLVGWGISSRRTVEVADTNIPVNQLDTGLVSGLPILNSDRSSEEVIFNEKLVAKGVVIVAPSLQPTENVTGQLYLDQSLNSLLLFNGDAYQQIVTVDQDQEVCVIGQDCGFLTTGALDTSLPQDLAVTATPTFSGLSLTAVATSNSVIIGGVNNTLAATNAATAGQLLVANSSGTPTFLTVAGDAAINSSGVLSLADTGVSSGTYGSSSLIPQFTVDAAGRITGVTTLSIAGGGGDILQNGNSFASAVTIGSNDLFDLNLETNGSTRLTVEADGDLNFDANTIFGDAANNRLGVGTNTPSYELDVVGNAQFSGDIQVGNVNTLGQCRTILGDLACDSGLEVVNTTTGLNSTATGGIWSTASVNPASTNSAINAGIYSTLGLFTDNDYTGTNLGASVSAFHNGNGDVSNLKGLAVLVNEVSTGTTTLLGGVDISVSGSASAGTITQAYGQRVLISGGAASTIIDGYGIDILSAANTINNFTALRVQDQTTASGSNIGIEVEGADTYALWLGSGADNTGSADGITFGQTPGTQANLYRGGDNLLVTDDAFTVTGDLSVAVNSSLVLVGGAALPGTPVEGEVYYDSTNNQLVIYDGAQWEQLNSSSSPTFVVAASDSDNALRADYRADGTSDETEINTAIDAAAAAGGGTVHLLEGTYVIDATIDIDSGVKLIGSGDATVITIADGFDTAIEFISEDDNATGWAVHHLLIDGNNDGNAAATISGVVVRDVVGGTGDKATSIDIEGITVIDIDTYGIELDNTANVNIRGSTISGATDGINADSGAEHIVIADNEFYSTANHALNIGTATDSIAITGNIISTASNQGMDIAGRNHTITGNVITHSVQDGVIFRPDDSIFSNNVVDASGEDVIVIISANDNIISNNVFDTSGVSYNGIVVASSNRNNIIGNRISNIDAYSIDIDNASSYNSVQSNFIETQTADTSFIRVAGDHNSIIDNVVSDISADTIGVEVTATANDTYIASNIINKAAGTDENVSDLGTNTVIAGQADIAGNYELQPTGSIELLANTDVTGTLTVSGTATFNGNVVIGSDAADSITVNAGSATVANDLAVTLSGGLDALNFDSNTLSIDALNNRVGIGTNAPSQALEITGNIALSLGAGRTISVVNQTVADTAGDVLTVQGAAGLGTGAGGAININSGTGGVTNGSGGAINLTAASGGGGSSTGGAINLTAGNGTGFGAGGAVILNGGDAATITGGTINVGAGNLFGAGGITITAGNGGGAFKGGDVTILGGNSTSGNLDGGDVILQPGTLTGSGTAGQITLQPQASNDTTVFLQIFDADGGAPILNVDSTNERVGIGVAGGASLDETLVVIGDIRVRPAVDAVDSFQVENNSSGDNVFIVDTVSDRIAIGRNTGAPQATIDAVNDSGVADLRLDGSLSNGATISLLEDSSASDTGFLLRNDGSDNTFKLQAVVTDVQQTNSYLEITRNEGYVTFQNDAGDDSTTAFQILEGDASNVILNVDSVNERVGIGTSSPSANLDVAGDRTTSAWGVNGVLLQAAGITATDSTTAASGTATDAVFTSFNTPTLAATNANVTVTNAATVYIQNSPIEGSNILAISNDYALWVDDGTTRLDGILVVGNTAYLNSSVVLGDSTADAIVFNGEVGSNITFDTAGSYDIGSTAGELDDIFLGDETSGLYFGLDQDASLSYDESGDDRVELTGSNASLFIEDRLSLGVDSAVIADTGDATPATLTLNPASSYVEITCNDTNGGCDITMGEASALEGDLVVIVNTSPNVAGFTDSSGVSELSASHSVTQWQALTMIYTGDRWVEISYASN